MHKDIVIKTISTELTYQDFLVAAQEKHVTFFTLPSEPCTIISGWIKITEAFNNGAGDFNRLTASMGNLGVGYNYSEIVLSGPITGLGRIVAKGIYVQNEFYTLLGNALKIDLVDQDPGVTLDMLETGKLMAYLSYGTWTEN